MVKIEGLSDREVVLREKTSRLVEITREVFGKISKDIVVSSIGTIHIDMSASSQESSRYSIIVSPDTNKISVESENYFKRAYRLAEHYESFFPEEQWTVKKLYER